MLRQTLLIAKREYLERVKSKVFRITTLLVPVGMGGPGVAGRHERPQAGRRAEPGDSLRGRQSGDSGAVGAPGEPVPSFRRFGCLRRRRVPTARGRTSEVASHQIAGYLTLEDVAGQVPARGDLGFRKLHQYCGQVADGVGGAFGADPPTIAGARDAAGAAQRSDGADHAEDHADQERRCRPFRLREELSRRLRR